MTEASNIFNRWNENTSRQDFLDEVLPFVEKEGFRLSNDREIADEILDGVLENIKAEGDSFCPCRLKEDDPDVNRTLICPCITFHKEQYAALQKCWCGLFVVDKVTDDEDLFGVMDTPESFDYPIVSLKYLPENAIHGFVAQGKEFTLVRAQDKDLFLLEGRCCHMGASLSKGFVSSNTLVCPEHGWQYDLSTGKTNHPGMDLSSHKVFVENGIVYMEMGNK